MTKTSTNVERFGRWSVLVKYKRGRSLARCQCGTERVVFLCNLLSGKSASCGCLRRETSRRLMEKIHDNKYVRTHLDPCHWSKIEHHSGFSIFRPRGIDTSMQKPDWFHIDEEELQRTVREYLKPPRKAKDTEPTPLPTVPLGYRYEEDGFVVYPTIGINEDDDR